MAIKERGDVSRTLEAKEKSVGSSQKSGPIVLTAEETASLLDSLTASPKPLSPEIKKIRKTPIS